MKSCVTRMAACGQYLLFCMLWAGPLYAGYDIESHGTTSGSIFSRIINFLQDCVDALDGPVAIALVIFGAVAAIAMWIFAPDNRHLGKAMKAVAGGFILFDIALLINYMRA